MNNTQKPPFQTIPCPECDTPLDIYSDFPLEKIVECPACGTENEIISINPFKIAPLEEEK